MSDINIKNNSSNSSNQSKSSNNNRYSYKGFFSILGILAIVGSAFGGYMYFNSNLGTDNIDNQAQAASTPATAFNPSDCATYTSNGGTSGNGICFVKLYEKNGNLFQQLDIAPGELVKVRNYYNNTTTTSVTTANITDSMPAGFNLVGSPTNTYVDASPVTLNSNIFTGQNLSVAPGAGYFGYASDNTLTSSNLELGKFKYINRQNCAYTATPQDNVRVELIDSLSNTPNTSFVCPSSYGNIPFNASYTVQMSNILNTGNRYIHQQNCSYASGTDNIRVSLMLASDNTAVSPATCPANYFTVPLTAGSIINRDTLGNRYIHQQNCAYSSSVDNVRVELIQSVDNSPTSSFVCPATYGTVPLNQGSIQSYDTSDTTRGHGYISYTMQTPTSGLTNGTQFGTTGTLNANGAKTSNKTNSLTVINANSANVVSGIIPSDCTTYPNTLSRVVNNDGTACTAKTYVKNGIEYTNMEVAPGETVTVRLRYNNSATTSADQVRLKDSIPTGWSLTGNASASYVDATPVSLGTATSIFNSPNDTGLDVAPHIGYFGASAATPSTDLASNLELGRFKYLAVNQCDINKDTPFTGEETSAIIPGWVVTQTSTQFTNAQTVTGNCTPSAGRSLISQQVHMLDIVGKRYFNIDSCMVLSSDTTDEVTSILPGWNLATSSTGFSNNPTPASGCAANSGDTLFSGTMTNLDILGNRYLALNSCTVQTPTNSGDEDVSIAPGWNLATSSTQFTNNTTTPTGCSPQAGDTSNDAGQVQTISSSDTNRAYGYLEYQMTSPNNLTTGLLTNNPNVTLDDTGGTTGWTTTDPVGSATLVGVSNPTPNINSNKLYSTDGGTTWSTTVNAAPGQSVKVRLWTENTGGISATSANIKDTLPSPFTYVAGSTRNCINPSTVDITNPNTNELICDTGTPTQKDSLFNTLTNASGVSPSAGLYDASGTTVASGGTAFNATSGVLEIGKRRYYPSAICC